MRQQRSETMEDARVRHASKSLIGPLPMQYDLYFDHAQECRSVRWCQDGNGNGSDSPQLAQRRRQYHFHKQRLLPAAATRVFQSDQLVMAADHEEASPLLAVSPSSLACRPYSYSTNNIQCYQEEAEPEPASQPPVDHAISTTSISVSSIVQLIAIGSLIVYTVAHTVFLAPSIQLDYFDRIGQWWQEKSTFPGGASGKRHDEMDRATFLFLYCVAPFAVGTIALEATRHWWSWSSSSSSSSHDHLTYGLRRFGRLMRRKSSFTIPRVFYYLIGTSGSGDSDPFSYGELLAMACLLLGNLVVFALGWRTMRLYHPLPGAPYTVYTTLEITGIVLGYNCVYNMAFLFIPTTRSSVWMAFMGIAYPNAVKFHRWLGVSTVLTAIGHALPFYPVWYHQGVLWAKTMPCWQACTLDYASTGYPAWFTVFGELSLLFFVLLGVTSHPWIRRFQYEWFYYAHFLFVPGVLFAILHWGTMIWWLLPSVTVYVVDRVRGRVSARPPVVVEKCSVSCDGIVTVTLRRRADAAGGQPFQVGQFVYLNVPAISKWQWHAFTIGSSPHNGSSSSSSSFTVYLKSLGNWTQAFLEYTRECGVQQRSKAPEVYVDGYYGASLPACVADQDYATLCLIGGGIGATPLFALLEDVAFRRDATCRKIHFVFTFRELSLLWAIHPVLQLLLVQKQELVTFTYEFYWTRPQLAAAAQPAKQEEDELRLVNSCAAVSFMYHEATQPQLSDQKVCAGRPFVVVALVSALAILGSAFTVLYLDYDGGVVMQHGTQTQYWPLQNLVDALVLVVLPLVAVVVCVLMEKILAVGRRLRTNITTGTTSTAVARWEATDTASSSSCSSSPDPAAVESSTSSSTSSSVFPLDIEASGACVPLSDRALLDLYDVTIGCRPQMTRVLSNLHDDHCSRLRLGGGNDRPIGVFVFCPEPLKRATEDAVAMIGSSRFDIHTEEFEL